MFDWQLSEKVLLNDSERMFRALFAEHEKRREPLAAIGYVFGFGRSGPCFELSANTALNAQASLAEYLAKYPDASADEYRWNSGDYDYSGAADQYGGAWSEEFRDVFKQLHRMAKDEDKHDRVHEDFAQMCCNVLAVLARRGVFGDWKLLDFNVSGLDDDVALVKERDQRIRQLIESAA